MHIPEPDIAQKTQPQAGNRPELTDKFGRRLNYLRLSVTDRCNFRCVYCMPENGMDFAAGPVLLSFEELYRLSRIFCGLGVDTLRITGGEPFIRKGLLPFLEKISGLEGLKEIKITSNGAFWEKDLERLKQTGIRKINISLDALDPERFYQITRRNSFERVYAGIFRLLEKGFELKLNCVVMAGRNTEDILPLIGLTQDYAISVRFLEEMPFNGSSSFIRSWDYKDIYAHISRHHPHIEKLEDGENATATNYKIRGHRGSFGIIPAYSRTFCGTCNRIRLSATGELRTCLYGAPAADLRQLLRSGADDAAVETAIRDAVSRREKDGLAAEASGRQNPVHASMSVLGG
ncbi:GTP 3',8-cyclase MoaA [Compostibacter hankyongensis]|uniref:GTP 3',8-cyclase n=1 Tax=Compostibacter hankyongensis TaxID=1007089 RepID=A0ABP8FLI4_9BACT